LRAITDLVCFMTVEENQKQAPTKQLNVAQLVRRVEALSELSAVPGLRFAIFYLSELSAVPGLRFAILSRNRSHRVIRSDL